MADLEQLKQKYASVLDVIKRRNMRLDHLHIAGDKLVLQGAAPNQDVKNEVWNAIKAVDSGFADLSCDISIDSSLPAPASAGEKYTVQAGDSLSKISKHFYGDASQYMRIFEANQDQLDDPNKIQIGQKLNIPAA
ncbi:MAG: LysM peptidoglycan-binding domain-containing protein [Chloroflexia bacterium]